MNIKTKLWTVQISWLPLDNNQYKSRKNVYLHVLTDTAEKAIKLVHDQNLNDCQIWSVQNRGNWTEEALLVDPALLKA